MKLQQQYLGGNVTDRSTILGHGGDDQPMQNDRHYYVEYGWWAEDQKKMGTPTRGEQKNTIKKHSRATRGGSYFSPRQRRDKRSGPVFHSRATKGVGLIFPPDREGSFPINFNAQWTPEVALQKGDFRYNKERNKKVPINLMRNRHQRLF